MAEKPQHDQHPRSGSRYWRSLDELAGTEEFARMVQREFPSPAGRVAGAAGVRTFDVADLSTRPGDESPATNAASIGHTSRRDFLKLMGASLALAGAGGCSVRQPAETIVPYVNQPEQLVPGKPLYFATAATLDGFATRLLVESHMGRPTKVEGNPVDPADPRIPDGAGQVEFGPTDVFAQAEVLSLYDPDRSQSVLHRRRIRPWGEFVAAVKREMDRHASNDGAGLRILTGTVTSPTLADQLGELLQQYPQARWHVYEPLGRENAQAGARMAFGEDVEVLCHFDRTDVILSLDDDFLYTGPGRLRHAREFARRRRPDRMNRLYMVESTVSITGAQADHRLPLRAGQIEAVVRSLAARLGVEADAANSTIPGVPDGWIEAVAADLEKHRGASLVVAGGSQPPFVHALAHAVNHALGNVGETIEYIGPVAAQPADGAGGLGELTREMNGGRVESLIILGGNPVYTAPADLEFAKALAKVPFRVHLSLYDDETSALCDWHVPQTHFLESWSDARAADGTATIIQPLIAPLYDGRTVHEVLSVLLGRPAETAHRIVRRRWLRWWEQSAAGRKAGGEEGRFDDFWQTALHHGFVPQTAAERKRLGSGLQYLNSARDSRTHRTSESKIEILKTRPLPDTVELVFRPDPNVWDGRYANNAWLQELPRPHTKLAWGNAALISPRTAQERGLSNEDLVELRRDVGRIANPSYGGFSLELPVWVVPGHPDGSVTVHLGYGRERAGRVGEGVGFNAFRLRTTDAMWFAAGVRLVPIGGRFPLACTQHHHLTDGRDMVRSGTLQELQKHPEHPDFVHLDHGSAEKHSLYPEWDYPGYKWGMVIDLNTCIGCNACVIACQAENNIPVVGKEEVIRGREMHWIRVDSYYEGGESNPRVHHQPVPCMHCEKAPCEPVCPVAATTHSDEGLNEMTYNRCVGTRYCSNNCPYKVRRFNYLHYTDYSDTPVLKLLQNPDVSVRERGVMEKCTYCVQRINAARICAEKEDRRIHDGEVVTACQAACPAEAIVFGDLNDESSRVRAASESPLNYAMLGELNTQPRTTYNAAVRNPNPAMGDQ